MAGGVAVSAFQREPRSVHGKREPERSRDAWPGLRPARQASGGVLVALA
jgi:hypothetical protein